MHTTAALILICTKFSLGLRWGKIRFMLWHFAPLPEKKQTGHKKHRMLPRRGQKRPGIRLTQRDAAIWGWGESGAEWGGNDARLNKLQSKGNEFKCSTWNYRGSNMERRSERVGSTGSDLPLSGQKTRSSAMATVMSSAAIQSKIEYKIGQTSLIQCHSIL